MAIALGLLAALTYGAGDFLGGLASRRADALRVLLVGMPVAGVLLLPVVLLVGGEASAAAAGWGAAAGVFGAVGVAVFYAGLATGPMNVVAPLTAVAAATLPTAAGLATGERPSPAALVGIVLALVAVVLVSRAGPTAGSAAGSTTRGAALALLAGAGFGLFFLLLDRSPDDSGLWPVLWARLASVGVVVAACLALRRTTLPPRRTAGLAIAASCLDVVANVAFLLAVREGLLTIGAVLTSLYPAVTIALARVVLHESLSRGQAVGLTAAALSVGLLATG